MLLTKAAYVSESEIARAVTPAFGAIVDRLRISGKRVRCRGNYESGATETNARGTEGRAAGC